MYCSIQEAWPEYDFGSHNKVHSQQTIESYDNIQLNKSLISETRPEMQLPTNNYQVNQINQSNKVNQSNQTNKNNKLNHNLEMNCDNFLDHISECSECRNKFMKYYCNRNYSLTKLMDEHPQLRETLLVFLIGLLILFLLNMLRGES